MDDKPTVLDSEYDDIGSCQILKECKLRRKDLKNNISIKEMLSETSQKVHQLNEEKNEMKNRKTDIKRSMKYNQSLKLDDDDYWSNRRNRVHFLLGVTSLRFDKSRLTRSKTKPAIIENVDENVFSKIENNDTVKCPVLSSKDDHHCPDIDKFWGLSEDFCHTDMNKTWKNGDLICTLNSRAALNTMREFLKQQRKTRSFYIERKPMGLAGRKGTWLTPPYRPPFEVKYGCKLKEV